MTKKLLLFFVITMSAQAQITGVVTDAETLLPVSYANIYLDDKNWISADEGGVFIVNAKPEDVLTFSSVGYETSKIKASEAAQVKLKAATLPLETITLVKPLLTIEGIAGGYNRKDLNMYYTTSGISSSMGRYFAPNPDYTKTPFLKKLVVATKSNINNAKFNIHILEANEDGTPGREIGTTNIIGIAKKGKQDTKIDLMPFRLRVPENGFFIGLEWLIVPENRSTENSYTDKKGEYHEHIEYAPFFGTTRIEGDTTTSWGFRGGQSWKRFEKISPERIKKFYEDFKKSTGKDAPPFDDRHVEFAMKLIMTN